MGITRCGDVGGVEEGAGGKEGTSLAKRPMDRNVFRSKLIPWAEIFRMIRSCCRFISIMKNVEYDSRSSPLTNTTGYCPGSTYEIQPLLKHMTYVLGIWFVQNFLFFFTGALAFSSSSRFSSCRFLSALSSDVSRG